MFTAKKQPAERLDYDIDLTEWFEDAEGDEIASATATVLLISGTGVGDTLAVDGAVALVGDPSRVVKVWLIDGVSGNSYKVTVRATTEGGRIKEVDFKVVVKET